MVNGWDGVDPTQQDDGAGTQYELATRFTANADITISGIRVWHGANSQNVPSRTGRLWTTAGTSLGTVAMDDTLPLNTWTQYNLVSPVNISNGVSFDVSYGTRQYYGATSGAYPNNSVDNNVTATQGRFAETIGLFPSNGAGSFYGIDIIFALNAGGNQAPDVTAIALSKNELVVTATATVDDESPASVVVRWDWGDGQSTTTAAGIVTAQHTYSTVGLYAIMATATDADGLDGSFAVPTVLTEEPIYDSSEAWLDDILDAVVSDVQASGYCDRVNTHEPKRKPGHGVTAAVWVQAIEPIALISGLASTSARILFVIRLYTNMLKEAQDAIDPTLMKATSNLIRRYHDDFDFEGAIRNVDLLGAHGIALNATAGYLEMDGTMFRTMDIFVPCLVNDVWPQVK